MESKAVLGRLGTNLKQTIPTEMQSVGELMVALKGMLKTETLHGKQAKQARKEGF